MTFGLFRLFMGTVIFVNLLMVGLDFDAWFSERGYVPWANAERWLGRDIPRLDLIAGVTDTRLVGAFYLLVTIAALFTALGLWTRVSSIALAVGLISLHHRNPIILHGGDTVMRAAAVYLAVGPGGAACSLDRLIALWRNRAPAIPNPVSLWPQRLLQYQMAIVYVTTVWAKWGGTHWVGGTATWFPHHLREFERFPVPRFLQDQPFLAITTYGTLMLELALGTLVFYRPLRKWVLLGGLLLHGYIEYAMNIPLFAFAMCSFYIAFYDGEEISAWAKRLGERLSRLRLVVLLPKGRRLAPGPESALGAVDPFDLVRYESGQGWTGRLSAWARSPGAWLALPFWTMILDRALEPAEDEAPRR